MAIRVRLPDLEHWKAQVKCQAGCPVATDAGRYVQLIAEGATEDAFLVARAPNPFASVCGRVCAAPCEDACRRGAIDAPISIRALKRLRHRAVRRRIDRTRTPRTACATTRVDEGNRYAGHLPVAVRVATPPPAAGRASEGRGRRRRTGRPGRGARPRAARLRRHRVRSRRRTGRDDALRHPGIPPAAHADPRGDRQDPRARRRRCDSARPLTADFGLAAAARARASRRSSSRSASRAGATSRCPASNSTASSRPWTTCSTSTAATAWTSAAASWSSAAGSSPSTRPARRCARGARRRRAGRPRGGEARRARQGGARLGPRGHARRRPRGHHRLARELRRDAGAAHHAGPRGVRGGAEGRRPVPHPARPDAASSATAASTAIELRGRHVGLRRERPLRSRLRRRRRRRRSRPTPASSPSASSADLSFLTPDDGVALTPGGTIRIDPATLATSAPGVYAGGDVAFGPRNLIEAVANGKRAARSIHEYLAGDGARLERHLDDREAPDVALPDDRRLRAARPRGAADARPRSPHRHRRGRNRLRRRRGAAPGGALPRLPRADDLRPREVRPLQPVRGHLPRALPGHRARSTTLDLDAATRAALATRAEANGLPAVGHGERRRALHPLRAVRHPLPDRRDDDGAVHDHGTVGRRATRHRPAQLERTVMSEPQTRRRPARLPAQARHRRRRRRAIAAQAGGVAALARAERVLRRADHREAGPPADFPDGLKFLPDERLFVFREGKTFHAISAVCTHLGCTVRAEALSQPEDDDRRRHSRCASRTASCARATARSTRATARTSSGPAPKPLAWYRLSVAPDDGQLVVDLADEVDHDFRLTLPEEIAMKTAARKRCARRQADGARRAPDAALEPAARVRTARPATPSSRTSCCTGSPPRSSKPSLAWNYSFWLGTVSAALLPAADPVGPAAAVPLRAVGRARLPVGEGHRVSSSPSAGGSGPCTASRAHLHGGRRRACTWCACS